MFGLANPSILWQLKEVCGLWLPSRNIKRKTHKKRGAANDQPPHVVNPRIQSLQYILNWNPGLGIYEGGSTGLAGNKLSTWRVKHHNSKALTPSGVESERWWIACSTSIEIMSLQHVSFPESNHDRDSCTERTVHCPLVGVRDMIIAHLHRPIHILHIYMYIYI